MLPSPRNGVVCSCSREPVSCQAVTAMHHAAACRLHPLPHTSSNALHTVGPSAICGGLRMDTSPIAITYGNPLYAEANARRFRCQAQPCTSAGGTFGNVVVRFLRGWPPGERAVSLRADRDVRSRASVEWTQSSRPIDACGFHLGCGQQPTLSAASTIRVPPQF